MGDLYKRYPGISQTEQADMKRNSSGAFAAMCCFLIFAALTLVACQPAENTSANTSPTNAAPDNQPEDTETPGEDVPAPPKEAQYPHQVNAELAKVYLKYNITDEAIRLFDLAIQQQLKQTNSEDAENWIGLGDALKNAGRSKEATLSYKRALQILEQVLSNAETNQQHNHVIGRIAAVCAVLGMNEKRLECLTKLKADDDVPAQQLELAQIFHQIGNVEKAEKHFKRALELTTDEPAQESQVKVAYANMLFALERYDDALPMAKASAESEQASDETRKLARRLVFEIYEATGETDKLDFKD